MALSAPTAPATPLTPVGQNGLTQAAASAVSPPPVAQSSLAQPNLGAEANAIAANEVAGKVAPLQSQLTTTQQQAGQQANTIQQEFQQLLPSVQTSAQQVQAFNQNAQDASQQIFAAAGQQLNTLQQNQAAQAQQMAQQTGGPVSTGAFTSSTDPYRQAEAAQGAVGQLTTLNLGLGADTSAQAFAGKVMPALEAEQLSSTRAAAQDQISKLETQIATDKGQQSTLAAAQLPGLIKAQQTYEYDQSRLQLARQTAAADNAAKTRALDQEDIKLHQQQQAQIQKNAQAWAKIKTTTQEDNIKNQQAVDKFNQTAAEDNIKNQQATNKLNAATAQYKVSNSIAKQRVQVQQETNVRSIIDTALGGAASSKPVTVTLKQVLPPGSPQIEAAQHAAITGKTLPNIYYNAKTNQWYTFIKQSMTPAQFSEASGSSGTPQSHPQELYNMLTKALPTANKSMIVGVINARLGLSGWSPGKTNQITGETKGGTKLTYTPQELSKLPLDRLTSVAETLGFQPSPLAISRGRLTDFILVNGPRQVISNALHGVTG